MGDFIGLVAVVLIFGAIPAIVIFIASRRHKERMEMLSKGVNASLFAQAPSPGSKSLLWGLIAVAVGLALLISSVLVMRHFDRGLMMASLILLFGGGATLLYWRITAKDREFARRLHEKHLAKIVEEYESSVDKEEKSESQ